MNITKERAREIITKRGSEFLGEKMFDCTDEEREAVRQYWLTLPGNTSWASALYRIADFANEA